MQSLWRSCHPKPLVRSLRISSDKAQEIIKTAAYSDTQGLIISQQRSQWESSAI